MRSDNKVYLSKLTSLLITLGLHGAAASLFFFLVNKGTLFHMKDNTRQDVRLFSFSFFFNKLKLTMGWKDLIIKILESTLDFWVAFLFGLPTCHA